MIFQTNRVKIDNNLKELFIRIIVYIIILLFFYLYAFWSQKTFPKFEFSELELIASRCIVTFLWVFISTLLVIFIALLFSYCEAFVKYWRNIKHIDKFYKVIANLLLFPSHIISITGVIPIFITATVCLILSPEKYGLFLTMIFGNLIILQIYSHIMNEIQQELDSGYLWGAMSMGLSPKKSLITRSFLAVFDISKSTYMNLLGLSIFVEYRLEKVDSSFKGITWELFNALYKHTDIDLINWEDIFQAICGIIFLVLIIDLLWSFIKIKYDKRV